MEVANINKLYQGYKLILYPTTEQKNMLNDLFIVKYKAYNWGLEQQYNQLDTKKKLYNRKQLTAGFMNEIDSNPKYQWLKSKRFSRHLVYYAFNDVNNILHDYLTHSRIFKNTKATRPKFKSITDLHKSFGQRNDMKLIVKNKIQVAKLGLIKTNKAQLKRVGTIYKPNQLTSIRFSFDGDNYWVSFNKQIVHPDPILEGNSIGIDLGLKTWATVSNDMTLDFPVRDLKILNKRLKKIDRHLCKLKDGSNNKLKEYRKRRLLIRRIFNLNKSYINQFVSDIVKLKPKRVVMEHLLVKQMNKSYFFDKKLQQAQFRYFRDQMEYRCTRSGIEFVLADTFFPSSQLCSNCGHRQKMWLNKRVYKCPECGLVIDRDLNASINLANYKK